MDLPVAAATHVGHVRQRNEDHAVVGATVVGGEHAVYDERLAVPGMVAVLDGMGGHPAGDVASRLVAELLADCEVPTSPEEADELVRAAQAVLAAHMREHPRTRTMGTTLVAAALPTTDRAMVVGVGDSSVLMLADGRLTELVRRDRSGLGWITQVLGGGDVQEPLDPHVVEVSGPGRLLLCSDGLADVVPDGNVQQVLRQSESPRTAAEELVELALSRGGPDNVTVAVVDLG